MRRVGAGGGRRKRACPVGGGALGREDGPRGGLPPVELREHLVGRGAAPRAVALDLPVAAELLGRNDRGVNAVLPAGRVETPPQNKQEAAVVVDYGETDCAVL